MYVYNYDFYGNDWDTAVPTATIYIKNLASNAKITNIKSSNKSMAGFIWSGYDVNGVGVGAAKRSDEGKNNTLRPGQKSKISFTVSQNGKKYKLSCMVTTKEFSPMKTLKIGSKDYVSTLKECVYPIVSLEEIKKQGSKVRVTYKSAPGFKIDEVTAAYETGEGEPKVVKVKSGSKISTKNLHFISIDYHVTKKPANYKKPGNWRGATGGALKDFCGITFL